MSWEPQGLGLTWFQERYARFEGETWEQACRRVAEHVAKAEDNGKYKRYSERFNDELISNRFMPGGRIWYGAGRPKAQLLNCISGDTLVHVEDEGLTAAKYLPGQTAKGMNVKVLTQGGVYRSAKWYVYGMQELFEVQLSNGDRLEATANHEWVTTYDKGKNFDKTVTTLDLPGRHIPLQHIEGFEYEEEPYREGVRHGLTFGDGSISHGTATLPQFGDSQEIVARFFEESRETVYSGRAVTVATKLPAHYKALPTVKNQSYIRGFIAGVIGADGCVDSRGHTMLHNKSYEVLVEIRKLAASVGIPSTSIKLSRKLNPWTGEEAPLYKLTFVKAAMWDKHMIIMEKHQEKMFKSPRPTKRATIKVDAVVSTGRTEMVYCCVEPETHTMVIGPGYLTRQCFVVPTSDSREGWGKTLSDVIVVSGTGGGVGVNLSPIRPRGFDIKGTGGKTTGSVSLMQMIDRVGDELVGGGGRRLALMLCLDVTHPDIKEFLNVKLNLNQLNNANISVVLSMDTSEFVSAVKEAKDLDLVFAGRATGNTINARELWDTITQNAWKSGEPGVLNGYEANRLSNIYYHKPLVSTNPCGEIWLEEYGCCCLGALVLPRFVYDGQLDWDALDTTIRLGVRFLDDVLTVNHYPLPEIKENCEEVRRIGLGVMGLHTMLLGMGFKYSSPEGRKFIDELFHFIKYVSYDASIQLAGEKGAFPAYKEEYLDSGFIKTLKRGVRAKIREYGIRNCALLTLAPTGTTSMVAGVSSGIEPLFAPVYYRHYGKANLESNERNIVKELVITPEFEMYGSLAEGAYDISPRDHFEVQKIVQRHVDNSISKTINLPKDFPAEDLSELWLEYLPYLKGTTLYREGSRGKEPLEYVRLEDAARVVKEEKGVVEFNGEDQSSLECPDGVCDISEHNNQKVLQEATAEYEPSLV